MKTSSCCLTKPVNSKSKNLVLYSGHLEIAKGKLLQSLLLYGSSALSIAIALLPAPGLAEELSSHLSTLELHTSIGIDASVSETTNEATVVASDSATLIKEPDSLTQALSPTESLVVDWVSSESVESSEQFTLTVIAPDSLAQTPEAELESELQPGEPETELESELQPDEPETELESELQPDQSVSQTVPGNRWEFRVMPYVLVPLGVNIDATVAGRSAEIDLGLGDILSLDRAFNAGLRVEGQKGRFGFFASGLYVFARQSGSIGVRFPEGSLTGFGIPVEVRTRTDGSIRIRQGTIDLAATYQAVNMPLGNQTVSPNPFRRLIVTPYLGIRINVLEERLRVDSVRVEGIPVPINPIPVNQEFNASRTNVTPLLGTQIGFSVSPRLAFGIRGDVSGFNIGARRNFAWNVQALTQYHFSPRTSLQLGYFLSNSDYEDGSGLRRSRVDIRQHGLLLGVIFRF
ncbi:hypothetical protein GS597_18085 [Synechococcales cyanobacterium C]|uniref:Outer membrane protein beta-barrel domain-containing protein n=1 Tax=Petrachloros mirabilis ULC683 TaxID=2781853 RepID=A0A8K2A277_9CYAN|nr:porin family protein [Petrachloros mirabilis]NCJ08381.1 hypothetical protein [Petrachloros mirabilis ULC683]